MRSSSGLAAVALLLVVQSAFAEPEAVSSDGPSPQLKEERNYLNFRVGGQAVGGNGRPQLCLEVSPIALIGIEACGTGAGILHNDPGVELSHYRAKVRVHAWQTRFGAFEPRVHLGFSEIQVGEDAAGFFFTSTGPKGTETAGFETGVSLRLLKALVGGFDVIGELAFDLSVLPNAPRLVRPLANVQPSAAVTVGVGF